MFTEVVLSSERYPWLTFYLPFHELKQKNSEQLFSCSVHTLHEEESELPHKMDSEVLFYYNPEHWSRALIATVYGCLLILLALTWCSKRFHFDGNFHLIRFLLSAWIYANLAKIYVQYRLVFDSYDPPVLNYLHICLFSLALTIIPC